MLGQRIEEGDASPAALLGLNITPVDGRCMEEIDKKIHLSPIQENGAALVENQSLNSFNTPPDFPSESFVSKSFSGQW